MNFVDFSMLKNFVMSPIYQNINMLSKLYQLPLFIKKKVQYSLKLSCGKTQTNKPNQNMLPTAPFIHSLATPPSGIHPLSHPFSSSRSLKEPAAPRRRGCYVLMQGVAEFLCREWEKSKMCEESRKKRSTGGALAEDSRCLTRRSRIPTTTAAAGGKMSNRARNKNTSAPRQKEVVEVE